MMEILSFMMDVLDIVCSLKMDMNVLLLVSFVSPLVGMGLLYFHWSNVMTGIIIILMDVMRIVCMRLGLIVLLGFLVLSYVEMD